MSFLDGFARGMQLAQQAVMMREGIEDRRTQREYTREDRLRAQKAGERQATLQELQIEQAQIDARRAQAAAAAETKIQAASKVTAVPMVVPGKKAGEMDTVYMVGNQRFANPELANQAAEAENTPLKIARRQYAAAQEVGIPDVARRYLDNYNATRTATEADFKQDFQTAMRDGGVDGVIQLYNGKVKDGRQLVAQRRPDGKFAVATYLGGKLQGDPMVYQDENQFLAEQVARYTATPDAYLDAYHKTEARREGARQFDASLGVQKDQLGETVRHNQAQEGIGRASVGVQQQGVNVQRDGLMQPKVQFFPTVTPEGNTSIGAGIVRPGKPAVGKTPGTETTVEYKPVGTQTGSARPVKPDPLAALLGQRGAPKQPGIQMDDNGLMRLDAMLK